MAKEDRKKLIEALQQKRESLVICYLTSTRASVEVQMAMDAVFKVNTHLSALLNGKKTKKIDLFLCSNGGDGTVPWRLVTLLREYCDEFNVLIPYRAFSAATLTALGADSIVMHRMGMLGPTDATVGNAFNPRNPVNPNQTLGISVEDVSAYMALVKEDAGINHEDELVLAFNKLVDHVHPLALGNVKRHISQSRLMARKLLCLHMNEARDGQKIDEVVENLTAKSFYHGHPINRKEARDQIGIPTVKYADEKEEELMWKLYIDFDAELLNETPFRISDEFLKEFPKAVGTPVDVTKPAECKLVFIESTARSDLSSLHYQLSGQRLPSGGVKVELLTIRQGWT